MALIHDHPTVGHPRRDETICKATEILPWTGMRQWIADYVKGCAVIDLTNEDSSSDDKEL